jgi:hypothetical protein
MNKLPDERELKALVEMAKSFETQIKEQSEIARKIAIKCEETINKKQNNQNAK